MNSFIESAEFPALCLIGFTATILVSRGNLPWLNGEVFDHTPFQIGYEVLGDLCSTFTGEILFQNVLLQTLALFICLNTDANRLTLMPSRNLRANATIIFIPLILVTFGPSTAMPLFAYQLSRDYRRVKPYTYESVLNAPSFTRTFYTLVAVVTLLVVGLFMIRCIGSDLDAGASTGFVVIPFLLASLNLFDIMVERSTNKQVDMFELRTAHYFAMTASALCLVVGFIVHVRSVVLICLNPSQFFLWATAGKVNSLFVLHYIITVATSYLWLDHHASVAYGPKHASNIRGGGILGLRDLPVILLAGPCFHFGFAATYREYTLMRQNGYKLEMRRKE